MAAAEVLRTNPKDTLTDSELIECVVEGNRDAFEILYERYFPRVFAFVNRRISNRADAEEVVQETFINVFSALGSFRGDAPFAAWVLGVARRTIWNRFKKKRHSTVPIEQDEPDNVAASTPRSPTPLEDYECQERLAQLRASADNCLTPEQRELFERHHLHHQSIQTIAEQLDKTENAVKSNLYRARKLLLA